MTLADLKVGDTAYKYCGNTARTYRAVVVVRRTKTKVIVRGSNGVDVAYGLHGQELPRICGYNYSGLTARLPEGCEAKP